MPEISVVVPVYNAGKTLDRCVLSILHQTLTDFELILINDGSKDHSLSICQAYAEKDSRIIVIDKPNEGSVATRKKGIEIAKGEYITFVDSDDWAHKKLLELLHKEMTDHNLDIAVCNTYKVLGWFKRKNDLISRFNYPKPTVYDHEAIRTELAIAYFWGHAFPATLHGKMYRKELVQSSGKYLHRIHFLGDDLFYNLEMLMKANRLKVINEPLYFYRYGGSSNKYMPYLFDDMVNGYRIQMEVVDEYYQDSWQQQVNGISLMFLNTFKICLFNMFNGKVDEHNIRMLIKRYLSQCEIQEAAALEFCWKRLPSDYLQAIRSSDVDYFYALGKQMYKQTRLKHIAFNVLSGFLA